MVRGARSRAGGALGAVAFCMLTSTTAMAAAASPVVRFVDGRGAFHSPAKVWASLQRTPPRATPPANRPHGDPDALAVHLAAAPDALPSSVDIVGRAPGGGVVGTLRGVTLVSAACPAGTPAGHACAVSAPIRAVVDAVDAGHPLSASRSVQTRLGGSLEVLRGGRRLARLRVGGPRQSALGPIARYRGKLRFVLVRASRGGALPVGKNLAEAKGHVRTSLERVNGLWGACGIGFGATKTAEVVAVDPPPPYVVSFGCGLGLPASGGRVRVKVEGRSLDFALRAGERPAQAARRFAALARRKGARVTVHDNPVSQAAAFASTDVSFRDRRGRPVAVSTPRGGAPSDDATMRVCVGRVNLEDGLQHFTDANASGGTLEERALIRAVTDDDPSTIDVVMVPGFGRGGRIGESFIGADGGSIRNVVLIDRAALRQAHASATLAHEIGHVLLDDPGHPDDHGRDTPTLLMDADASDPTAFGPRRLPVATCVRALRQSGVGTAAPLLAPAPL